MSDSSSGNEKPSYLRALLFSEQNLMVTVISTVITAMVAEKLGLPGALLCAVLYSTGEALAALAVPRMGWFRYYVDKQWSSAQRDKAIAHLKSELKPRTEKDDERWLALEKMTEQSQAVRAAFEDNRSGITVADVESTEDTCVLYMGVWLSALIAQERLEQTSTRDLESRIADIDAQIKESGETRELTRARSDLQRSLDRRKTLRSQISAAEARLIALPEAVEDIYQATLSGTASGDTSQRLREAVERLQSQRNVEELLDEDVTSLFQRQTAVAAAATRVRR
jgi:hypothetical protein